MGQTQFPLTQESDGTKKLVGLASLLVRVLEQGSVLVIDELEAQLHPLISRGIVQLFHNPDVNRHGAQLIAATHDTHLLDADVLRPDQVWFVEKSKAGATDLYSLVEFSDIEQTSWKKDYIQGRYGAIPFLGGLHAFALDTIRSTANDDQQNAQHLCEPPLTQKPNHARHPPGQGAVAAV